MLRENNSFCFILFYKNTARLLATHARAPYLVGGGGAVGVGGAVVVATAAPELHGAHPAALVVGVRVRVRQDGSVLCRRRRRWWREEVRRAAAVLRELLLEPVDHCTARGRREAMRNGQLSVTARA